MFVGGYFFSYYFFLFLWFYGKGVIVMAYVAPSVVSTGDSVTSVGHNIIVNDILDHETRIVANTSDILKGVQSYTTTQKNALTGVSTGTQVYDSTLGLMQVWNGAAWYAASGLVPLIAPLVDYGAGNVANTSAEIVVGPAGNPVTLSNVFPTSITAFRVVVTVTNMASPGNSKLIARLTSAGSPIAGAYNTAYRRGVWTPNGAANPSTTFTEGTTYAPGSAGAFYLADCADFSTSGTPWNSFATTSFDLFFPSQAQYKSIQGMAMATTTSGTETSSLWFTGMQYEKTVSDGIFFGGLGGWGGKIRVYGYVG